MTFGHNGETLEIQKDDYELLLKENPKKIYIIDSEGKISEYTLKEQEHHYLGYLKYAHDVLIPNHSMELSGSIEFIDKLYTNKEFISPSYVQAEGREVAQKIKATLLERNYIIIESWLSTYELDLYYVITPFINSSDKQKEAFMSLYQKLDLISFTKKSKNDMDGIILVKNLYENLLESKKTVK